MGRKTGKKGGKRLLKRDFGKKGSGQWENHPNRAQNWGELDLNNPEFEEYYKAQGIVPEGEWDAFITQLRTPLPTTFRINGRGKFAADLRNRLEQDFFSQFKEPVEVQGETLQPPRPLPWYPDKLAWHMTFSREQLRNNPKLNEVHKLVIAENEAGAITRQEAVSMIPPLLLDVQPHHRVLDTCAAPGSKTAQILEMLHQGSTAIPTGMVLANDSDAQRCNLLVHQTKRMCSPALMVVNHDATQMPILRKGGPKGEAFKFDRVLCDVPCSGDGTLRKAPDIWRRWAAPNGNGLHPLQLRIALHAAHLLRVGGRLVYSTCSFNPVEDEAVVAELLRRSKSALVLMDVSTELPDLKRTKGLTNWLVKGQSKFYSNWGEAIEEAKETHGRLCKTMFPEDASNLHLERCMRVLPHHMDTGGFFIAVLQKVAELPANATVVTKNIGKKARPEEPEELAFSAPAQRANGQPRADNCDPRANLAGTESQMSTVSDTHANNDESASAPRRRTGHEEITDLAYEAADHTQDFAEEIEDADIPAATESAGQAAAAVDGVFHVLAVGEEAEQEVQEQPQGEEDAEDSDEEINEDLDIDAAADAFAAAARQKGYGDGPQHGGEPLQQAGSDETAETRAAISGAVNQQHNGAAPGKGKMPEGPPGKQPADDWKEQKDLGDRQQDGAGPSGQADWVPRGGSGRGSKHHGVDPVVPFTDPVQLQAVREFYGIGPEVDLERHLVTRSTSDVDRPKRLYFIGPGIREVLMLDKDEQLKISFTGLKIFERQEAKDVRTKCIYRIAQEGMPLLLPLLTKQVIHVRAETLLRQLDEGSIALPEFLRLPMDVMSGGGASAQAKEDSMPAAKQEACEAVKEEQGADAVREVRAEQVDTEIRNGSGQVAGLERPAKKARTGDKQSVNERIPYGDPDLLDQLNKAVGGCCVFTLRKEDAQALGVKGPDEAAGEGALAVHAPLAIACWRGRASVNLLVNRAEAKQLAEKLRYAMAKHRNGQPEMMGAQVEKGADVQAS